MPLTIDDLTAIGKLIDDKLEPLKTDVLKMDKRVDNLERLIESMHDSQLRTENVLYPQIQTALDHLLIIDTDGTHINRIDFLESVYDDHEGRIMQLEHSVGI